jgi:hypothetical protein
MSDPQKILRSRGEYNLDNFYQRNEAAGLSFRVADAAFDGSLAHLWLAAEKPHGFTPELDGRSAEAKALKQAEADLLKALEQYDAARRAAKAKAKKAAP